GRRRAVRLGTRLLGLCYGRSGSSSCRPSSIVSTAREFWLWHSFRDRSWAGLVGEEDAAAEQVWAGAPVHLAFEHLDAVDVAFDHARAVGQGEPGGDSVLVGA